MYNTLELIEQEEKINHNTKLGITKKELTLLTSICERGVQADLHRLIKSGFINRVVVKNVAYYKTKKDDEIGGMINDIFRVIVDNIW